MNVKMLVVITQKKTQEVDKNINPIESDQVSAIKKETIKGTHSSSKVESKYFESSKKHVKEYDIKKDKISNHQEKSTNKDKKDSISYLIHEIPDISEERMNAVKNYSKVDQAIESKLMLPTPYNDELIKDDLWKILYPIIKVKITKPSEEYHYIPYIEPLISEVDISQTIQRPLAIPKEIQRIKKAWYSNKVFISFNNKKDSDSTATEKMIREENAEIFIKQIEKKAVILKKRS